MADIVLQAVIQNAVDIASNLVIEEGSYFSGLKADINWIGSEMRYIQSYLEDIDSRQAGDNRAGTLMSDIRDLGLDVEDILDKYSIEIESAKRKGFFSWIFSYIYKAHNFKPEIEGIKEKVNDINRRRQTYGIQERHSSGEEGTWNARRSFPHLEEPNIIGFEKHINTVVDSMLDESSQHGVVSITGMAGVGKTTLAKKVYNSCRQRFECSAWICVSQQPNIAELLRDIARQVGLEKEKWEHDVEANLFAFLCHKRGSAEIMKEASSDPPELQKIGEEILRRCGGVPLAIVLVAGEIGNLRFLSYFRLTVDTGGCGDLPTTISKLKNLVTLDIRGCHYMVVPHIIWNMKKLRHILLSEFCEIKFDSGGLLRNIAKALHSTDVASINLQTLYCLMIENFPDNYSFPKFTNLKKLGFSFGIGSNLSDAKVLLDLIILPQKLEILRLHFLFTHAFNIMDLNLPRFENLFRLHLEGPVTELPEYDDLPQNLTKLTLIYTFLKADPMDTLKKLPKLKILKFGDYSYMGEKMMVCSRGGTNNFPQLQVLDISGLHRLEELVVEEEGMPHLAKLRMKYRNLAMRIPRRIHDLTEKVEIGFASGKRQRIRSLCRWEYYDSAL
ncbi:hypothetical protein Acr_00g0073310 [Actinidia rufa]|uniref:NB-ARC domain-containing disease resistance protein n=1 Tax=Actinidia rufa TaxID=165716 RepID=A0A7J0DS34_9ERIC|nr:hypothetical protein Acr_00g0073310 [Actinidia rufa]